MTRSAGITVRFKPCRCGVLVDEQCDCEEQARDLALLLANPIYLTREKVPDADSADGLPPGDEQYQ